MLAAWMHGEAYRRWVVVQFALALWDQYLITDPLLLDNLVGSA